MLYREIMAVCSEIHTKHTNTLCGQNVELLNVKLFTLHCTAHNCIKTKLPAIPTSTYKTPPLLT